MRRPSFRVLIFVSIMVLIAARLDVSPSFSPDDPTTKCQKHRDKRQCIEAHQFDWSLSESSSPLTSNPPIFVFAYADSYFVQFLRLEGFHYNRPPPVLSMNC